MHRSFWVSATVRVTVWLAVSVAAVHLVHNPTPTLADVLAAVPFLLLFTSVPGLLYVFLVRTWRGSVAAGAGIVVVELALVAAVSAAGASSSTAGVGLVALPPFLLVPVLATVGIERLGRRRNHEVRTLPVDGSRP